jgi:hypothetical protein
MHWRWNKDRSGQPRRARVPRFILGPHLPTPTAKWKQPPVIEPGELPKDLGPKG